MALTINIEGTGVIANADAYATDGLGGTWGEDGAGTVGFNPDVYLYGSGSIGSKYASKAGYTFYNHSSALNFGSGGGAEGELIYLWVNIQSASPFLTLANKGFAIRVATSLTDYRDFIIAGKDDSNGWAGGWKCFVLDPTKTGSVADTGTYDVSNINYIGLWIDTDVSVRADSIFIDQIAVGSGLRVTGTSTTAWLDVVNYCTDYTNRAWGMFEEREGVYYAKGKIYIGDTTQTAITSFADSGRVVKFETSEYWDGTSAWVSGVNTDAFGIVIADNATYTTTFSDGVLVGSDNGRSGSTIIGSYNEDISLDLHGGSHADSATLLYGTKFQGITGLFNLGDDTGHKMFGCTVVASSQFDPVGAPVIRNCVFAETVDVDSAILWNANIDIQSCQFIGNTLGAAIEHSVQGSFIHNSLTFSGNTYDLLYSAPASSGVLTINCTNGSDTATYEILNATGNSVDIQNPKYKIFTGLPTNTEIRVRQGSTTLAHEQDVISGSYTYNYSPTGAPALAQFTLPGYIIESIDILLDSTDQTLPVTVKNDPSYQ